MGKVIAFVLCIAAACYVGNQAKQWAQQSVQLPLVKTMQR